MSAAKGLFHLEIPPQDPSLTEAFPAVVTWKDKLNEATNGNGLDKTSSLSAIERNVRMWYVVWL